MPLNQPLIIGAGVAGLALAVGWRQAHGSTPLLCERLEGSAHQGFGFLLLPRGLQALEALGVDRDRELEPHPIEHTRLVTPEGETIAEHRLEPGTLALDRSRRWAPWRWPIRGSWRRCWLPATSPAPWMGWPPSSTVAAAAACSAEGLAWQAAFLEHLRQRRDQAIDALRAIPGLTVSRPAATYVAFVGLLAGGESAEALVERLRLEHGLALVPGSPRWFGPGGVGHVRLCFATGEAILAEGLRRFAAGMAAAPLGRSSFG